MENNNPTKKIEQVQKQKERNNMTANSGTTSPPFHQETPCHAVGHLGWTTVSPRGKRRKASPHRVQSGQGELWHEEDNHNDVLRRKATHTGAITDGVEKQSFRLVCHICISKSFGFFFSKRLVHFEHIGVRQLCNSEWKGIDE
jgi:hypothetical protein